MDILITSGSYYPRKDGVSIVTQYQAEGLVRMGHKVTVITGEQNKTKETETHNHVKIIRIRAFAEWMLPFGEKKRYQMLVLEMSRDMDICMIVNLESWTAQWILPVLNEVHCAKCLMNHGIVDMSWRQFYNFSLFGIVRKIWGDIRWRCFFPFHWGRIKMFDAVIQLHEKDYGNRYFIRHGIDCEILYNAVDEAFFENDGIKKARVINVGTYCERKNQIKCMEIFYRADTQEYELVLIGQDANRYYKKLLKKKKEFDRRFGYRKVHILYGLNRKETAQYVRQSKIYLLTSITEMFPVSLLEAMAAGCAFVSTDVGVDRYLPGGITARRTKKLVGGLNALLKEEMRKDYARQGAAFAGKNCRQDIQVRKLEGILRKCLEHKI